MTSSEHITSTDANCVRVITTKVQSIKVVTNGSIGTCSFDLCILYRFETSDTASCGTTGIILRCPTTKNNYIYIYSTGCNIYIYTVLDVIYIYMYDILLLMEEILNHPPGMYPKTL